ALVVAGLAWVGEVRSAIRAVWLLDEHPGQWWTRLLTDLLLLLGLGMLLLLSVAITMGVSTAVRWTAADAVGIDMAMTRRLVSWLGLALGIVINTLLAAATLTALPRLKPPMRQILGPALLVAAGLELLKTVGRLYFERSEANPAYQAVASTVGLLLFLYLLNHLVLFAAALAATSSAGETKTLDLAEGGVVVSAEQRTA
ncbi:MAG: YhjD/YihY/BrkB family envelope integrity protein, partial [Micromonosporaceae bacterium]